MKFAAHMVIIRGEFVFRSRFGSGILSYVFHALLLLLMQVKHIHAQSSVFALHTFCPNINGLFGKQSIDTLFTAYA